MLIPGWACGERREMVLRRKGQRQVTEREEAAGEGTVGIGGRGECAGGAEGETAHQVLPALQTWDSGRPCVTTPTPKPEPVPHRGLLVQQREDPGLLSRDLTMRARGGPSRQRALRPEGSEASGAQAGGITVAGSLQG